MNYLNISDMIITENNKVWVFQSSYIFLTSMFYQDSKPGEVDLHGLFVKEAIEHTDEAIQAAQQRGESEIHLIVGACIAALPRLRLFPY